MKNLSKFIVIVCLAFAATTIAQNELILDPNDYINNQILGDTLANGSRAHSVYKLERSKFYALDGRMDIKFRLEIVGPDNGGMLHDMAEGHPPVIVNTPDAAGNARPSFQLLAGGEIILKNFIMSGLVSTGLMVGDMMTSNGGKRFEAQNMVFCDWEERIFRSRSTGIDVKITDCVYLNGGGLDYGVFDGMSTRFDVTGNSFTLENNTMVNVGREICNAGPFLKMKTTILHNSFINMIKCAHEMRHNEMISANNYWLNWEFIGYGPNQIRTNDIYQMHFTTYNDYLPIKNKLDSVSCYFGQNGFIIEDKINAWFATKTAQDSIHQSGYWEIAAVDSFVVRDNNFKIGTNYLNFHPQFVKPAHNTDLLVQFTEAYWTPVAQQPTIPPDYRVPYVVYFAADGTPQCVWPLPFDLRYSNTTWLTGGSDGLPLGDLNWYPDKKAIYLANRDKIIAALRDSMMNAKAIYKPPARTPFISPTTHVAGKDGSTPEQFSLAQNYPNPFNPSTNITYTLAKANHVTLVIYNMLGQEMRSLVDAKQAAGSYSIHWNGLDNLGKPASGGVYFYRLKIDNQTVSKKMVLLK